MSGSLLAQNGCQSAVLRALRPRCGLPARHALRQRLREWLWAVADKAAPCQSEVEVAACFAPLLRWVLAWWQREELALALDATYLGERVVVIAVSVLYRGTAIPLAWQVLPASRRGLWLEPALAVLTALAPAVPPRIRVLLADRGCGVRDCGSRSRRWGGLQTSRGAPPRHAGGDLGRRAARAWNCLTELSPEQIGAVWYGLRTWIELGFRALKSLGWHWECTRRGDPERVPRHWLVLAVATLWAVAVGTRVEDAERLGREPARVRQALPPPPGSCRHAVSVLAQGLTWLPWQLLRQRRLWRLLWLWPEPWPDPPATLTPIAIPP